MATLANLVVRITGNSAQLNKAVDKAQTKLGKFGKGAGKVFSSLGSAAKKGAIGAGGRYRWTGHSRRQGTSSDLGDQLDKMSKRTGFSQSRRLGELKFAAEHSPGRAWRPLRGLPSGCRRRSLMLALGSSPQRTRWTLLGISVSDLQRPIARTAIPAFRKRVSRRRRCFYPRGAGSGHIRQVWH